MYAESLHLQDVIGWFLSSCYNTLGVDLEKEEGCKKYHRMGLLCFLYVLVHGFPYWEAFKNKLTCTK